MASCLNITDRLKKETKQIQIGDDVFTVNTAFESMVEIEALERNDKVDFLEKMIQTLKILLPEYDKLKALKLSVEDTIVVFTAVMAVVNACTYEEMEARFQELKQ